jgi:hypothetical protein
MSDYIRDTLSKINESTKGATISINPYPQRDEIPGQPHEKPEGDEPHSEFPLGPKHYDSDTQKWYDEEGNEFNPAIEIDFGEDAL